MQYTVIVNNQSYDLPPKTLPVMEKIETVLIKDNSNIPIKEKYKAIHTFIANIVGKDNAKEIFGTDNLNEMDLSEVTICFKKIIDAYDKPVADYMCEKSTEAFNALPLDKITDIVQVTKELKND